MRPTDLNITVQRGFHRKGEEGTLRAKKVTLLNHDREGRTLYVRYSDGRRAEMTYSQYDQVLVEEAEPPFTAAQAAAIIARAK